MTRHLRRLFVFAGLLAACWGCAKSNESAPSFSTSDGGHPSGWERSHGETFLTNPDQCRQCHGDDLTGGIAGGNANGGQMATGSLKGGCFASTFDNTGCHGTQGPFGHPDIVVIDGVSMDWESAHPRLAMSKPQGLVDIGIPTGFVLCKDCHGTLFDRQNIPGPKKGEVVPALPESMSCVGCHGTGAPHSSADAWLTDHPDTNAENAPACAACHRNQQNLRSSSAALVSFAYDATASAGCFNNTLCHGNTVNPHPDNWTDPSVHGTSAKAYPTKPVSGMVNCSDCHGANFSNFTPGESQCISCHPGTDAPHPADWAGGGTYTHRTTDPANAPACSTCHSGGRNSPITLTNPAPSGTAPGCFNGTLCHRTGDPHPDGWEAASQHGAAAVRTTPSKPFAGLLNCNDCHGPKFTQNCAGVCHTPAHPNNWESGHRTILQAQDVLQGCVLCHRGSRTGTPGCFNGTLCHTGTPD